MLRNLLTSRSPRIYGLLTALPYHSFRLIGVLRTMPRYKHLTAAIAALATLGALSACSSATTSASGGGVYTTIDENNPITVGAPMNPFNAATNTFLGYDTMQLGFTKKNPSDPNDAFPGLAKTWTISSTGVTVQLQPNAKWSDGTPVTADDIKASMAIALTQGNATVGAGFLSQGLDVASVKAVGAHGVEIDQVPGVNNLNFGRLVLSQTIVSNKVYGSLLPADIWQTIADSENTDVAVAQKAVDKLTATGQRVSAFAPKTDVSAGPFAITRINPGSAVLDRNKYFYDVAKIAPKQVVIRHYTGNSQIWSYMTNGELDSAPYTAIPSNVLKRILSAGYGRVDSTSYVDAAIAFNESVAPYNNTAVRQALAYVIDRQAVTKVGEPVGGVANTYNTGLIDSEAKTWLAPEQISGLNKYAPDVAKATSLLEAAGFKKSGGTWHLPNGKPWTITLQTVNGFSDWIAASTVIANELTAFGIPTKPAITADFATYKKEMAAGKYAVGWWLTALGPETSKAYQRYYGTDDGYTQTGATAKHSDAANAGNWEHTPTSYTLNGSSFDPGQLTAQLSTMDLTAQKPVVQKLAQASNQEVPMIQIWDYTNVQFTSSKRFTNFPKQGQDALLSNPPGVWMMQGYVQSK
ncbi:ABC transporter substrate-binding protein [Streptomyces sp. CA-106110]|uniref:ABC transporter substrate-binding protein n=1 Tax=Streptomyces sp. CA-106110 TaxID=3240044 RepID=UPI003D8CB6BA